MSESDRTFDLADILSVTTGRLVSPRGMDGVYDLLNYLTGDNLYTHQLPRAMVECVDDLLAQLPELRAVDASAVTPDTWRAWLDVQYERYGAKHALRPVPREAHEPRDPVEELQEMASDKPIIVVKGGKS